MKFSLIVIMSLSVFVPTSSFFLHDYLTKQINNNVHNETQLNFALAHQNTAALTLVANQAKVGSSTWLMAKQSLAQHSAYHAYTLGLWYLAQYENLSTQTNQQVQQDSLRLLTLWLQQAIRLGSDKAVTALSRVYYQQGKLRQAKQQLTQLAELSLEAFMLRVKLAIDLGETDFIYEHANDIEQRLTATPIGQSLLAQLHKYMILTNSKKQQEINKQSFTDEVDGCMTSIQVFATRLQDLSYADDLIKQFSQKPLAPFVCFAKPLYLPKQRLQCEVNDNQAILCDEYDWQSIVGSVNTRHVALLLPKGGANVHYGILYLAADDDIDVFHHEVSHLLGFADEYPVKKQHKICLAQQESTFAHNIAVLATTYSGTRQELRQRVLKKVPWAAHIKPSTPILQAIEGKKNIWQLGTPALFKNEVGIFLSNTCVNSEAGLSGGFAAFKASASVTQLEYFEKSFPELYLHLLSSNRGKFLMPSFHYNIAFAAYNQGAIKQANYWLAQAAKWETDSLRKAKVLAGSY